MTPPSTSQPPAPLRKQFSEEEEFDWRALLMAARERLWLIIVLPVLGAAIGYAYIKKTPSMYQSRATLEIEDKQQVVKFEEVTASEMRDIATMNTVAATIQSRSFLLTVANRERFHLRKGFFGEKKPESPTAEDAVGVLSGALKAAIRPNTRLIDINARHTDKELARDIANAAGEGLIRFGMEQKTQASSLANDFLVQEARRLKDELEKSENDLQQYRADNKAVSLEKDQNLVVAELNTLNAKLSAATSERAQMETDVSALKSLSGDPSEALQLRSVSNHPLISNLTQAIANKKSEIAVIQNRYKPKHPKYIALQTQLNSLQGQLLQALPQIATQLNSTLENAKTNEAKMRDALALQEKKALELDQLAVKYNVRKRDVDTNKTMYESVLSRLKEVDLTKGMENNNLKIQETAMVGGSPVWPIASKVYGAGVGGGLMLAFGLAFLMHFMDRSIKTVQQAEKALNLPVMAAVCMGKKDNSTGGLDAWKEPHGSIAESFRSLRAMASLLGKEEDRRTFLLTSAVPSEGKTFCSSNFAAILAQQGLRTLLIDADLRKPRVSEVFFGEHRKPGLTDYLVGKAGLSLAVHPSGMDNLMIMPAGERAPNPAELLAGGGVKQLLAEALQHFDRVIIDSAPVVAVSDTLLLAPLVETVFQVIQWNRTPAPVMERAISMLRDAGKPPAGLILNQLPVRSNSYYYYYSPGYYGSEGVYGAPA